MNINEILKVKISAMKTGDSVDSYEVVWDRRRNTDKVEKMTTEHIYDITQELGRLAIIMDLDTPLGVCEFLKWTCSSVFYTMWVNSGAFAQYIADKPLINLLKKLRDRLITITKWWERYGDEIYIKCINEPEDKTLPSASDRCELENNYKVASEWLEIIGYANISEPDKPEGIKSMTHTLPAELDNEMGRRYLSRAVEAGLMSEQYKWLASQSLLACFCREMSVNLDLGKGYSSEGQKRLSWKPFEALFNVKAKNLTTSLNDIKKTGQDPIGIEKVEAIFKD